MRVAVVNRSTVLSDAYVTTVVSALDVQWNHHFRSLYPDHSAMILDFVPQDGRTDPGVWELVVADDADVAKALGYHEVIHGQDALPYLTEEGEPRGYAFARTALGAGAQPSVTISHELLEMGDDPDCIHFKEYGGVAYAKEPCDPVEADRYGYKIGDILVSNFITPAWYGPNRTGTRYDYLGLLKRPRALLPGGYAIEWSRSNGWHEVYASETDGPQVKRQGGLVHRPGTSGRTARRLREMEDLRAVARH